MIDTDLLQELIACHQRIAVHEARRKGIARFLVSRFGSEAEAFDAELMTIDGERLDDYLELAATCPDLDAFRRRLDPEIQRDAP